MENPQGNKQALMLNEDNFFYGLVISFFVFFLGYPEFDVTSDFLKPYNISVPHFVFITTRELFIIFLLLATITRYLTATTQNTKRLTQLRVLSACLLLFVPYFIIFDLCIRGLGGLLVDSGNIILVLLVIITPAIQIIITTVFGLLLEKRWYKYYGYDGRFLFGSLLFSYLGLFFIYVYFLAFCFALLGISLEIIYPATISIILTVLTFFADYWYMLKKERKKRENNLKLNYAEDVL